jgi:hypothetical protein
MDFSIIQAISRTYCDGFDGAGDVGCGDDEPEPVVLGGVTVRLAVVGGEEPLFAVLL